MPSIDPLIGTAAGMLVVCFSVLILTRRHHVVTCRELVLKLHPYQLQDVMDLLESAPDNETLWRRTRGFEGLWKRWRNRVVLVRLAQAALAHGHATSDEMVRALRLAKQLSRASFVALFYSLVCSGIGERAASNAYSALRLYAELAGLVHSLFADESAPLCANLIASLL